MKAALLILLGLVVIGGALAACTRTHLYVYKESERKQVKIFNCHYEEETLINRTGELINLYIYTDVTKECLNTFRSKTYRSKHGDYEIPNLAVNGTTTRFLEGRDERTGKVIKRTFRISLHEYTVKLDLNGEIKFPWGSGCKFSEGNCSNPNNETQGFVWDTNQRPKDASLCDSLSMVSTESFKQYLLNGSGEYLFLEKDDESYLLQLKDRHPACGTEIWKTARDGCIISPEPIPTDSVEVLDRKWAVDRNAGHFDIVRNLRPRCNDSPDELLEEGRKKSEGTWPISNIFVSKHADANHVRELLQKATYVLYICVGILAYIVVTLVISIYDLLMNYYTFKTEDGASNYLFQSSINRFYAHRLEARKNGEDDAQNYYSTVT